MKWKQTIEEKKWESRILVEISYYRDMTRREIKFLAPYRAEMAKREQLEYNDLTERAKNGKTNQKP